MGFHWRVFSVSKFDAGESCTHMDFVKPEKIRNFQEKWQIIIIIIIIKIIIINRHNGSGKPRKFSRSWMTK